MAEGPLPSEMGTSTPFAQCGTTLVVVAAEELVQGRRVVEGEPLPQKTPAFRNGLCFPRKLEVIDVDHKEESQLRLKVAATPIRYGHEANGLDVHVAFIFPVPPRVGMAVQNKSQDDNWVAESSGPALWPSALRKPAPCLYPA